VEIALALCGIAFTDPFRLLVIVSMLVYANGDKVSQALLKDFFVWNTPGKTPAA
jgi:hypothetical protein